MVELKRKKATISDVAELLAGWSDSEFATAASGEYCEDLKSMIEGAIARALDPTPPAETAGLVARLTDEGDLCRNDGADDIAELLTEAAATLTAQAAEIARLREALNKANLPEWFYHPDYTESALYSPYEVIEERYDFEPGWHIAEIDCAKSLPAIWCAVHVRTDDEMDALETDDRVVFTEHASREGAEAALTGSQSHD